MTNTTDFQQAVASEQRKLATREIKHTREQALMGDVTGTLTGPSGVPWILARLGGDPSRRVEAYNGTSLVPTFNMSVTLLVRYEDGRATHYEVERLSNDVAYGGGYVPSDTGGYAPHRWAHEYRPDGTGGWDAVLVYPRAMTQIRVSAHNPPDMGVYVGPGWYTLNGVTRYWTGANFSSFSAVPVAGIRYDLLSIGDPPGSGINFSTIDDAIDFGPPIVLTTSPSYFPVCAVQLATGQTAITEEDLIQDVRPFLNWGSSGGGGGGTTTEIATDRWVATAAQTDFALPDTAQSLITVSVNGLISDPLSYSLSVDGNTLTFASGLTVSDIVVASYVVLTI